MSKLIYFTILFFTTFLSVGQTNKNVVFFDPLSSYASEYKINSDTTKAKFSIYYKGFEIKKNRVKNLKIYKTAVKKYEKEKKIVKPLNFLLLQIYKNLQNGL